jgi:MFS family permease
MPSSRLSALGRAFRHRNYRLFFGGQAISMIGTWMQSVALAWLLYRLTGSAALLGLVGFCSQFPVFVLAPIGGAVADRTARRRILVATQTASMLVAATLAVFTLTGHTRPVHIFVLATSLGVVNAFDIPARQAFVVELVQPEDLMNAIALNSSIVNGARIVGPALAGFVIAVIGEGLCFLLNAVSFLGVIGVLLRMRGLPVAMPATAQSPTARIVEGFRFVWRARPIGALLLLVGLMGLMGTPYIVLMPIFAADVLHRGAGGLGLLMGASGLGALTAALVLGMRGNVQGLGHWVALSAAGFGASLIVFSVSRTFWLSAALLVPVGFGMLMQVAASNTLIQSMTPNALRGRTMAAYSMMVLGMSPFGALLAGALATRVGPAATVAIGGGCCILGAAVFGWKLGDLRAEARALIGAMAQEASPEPTEHAMMPPPDEPA